jgi:hypothetical protein
LPIIKYDSRAGRVFRVDRSDSGGRWENTVVEITPVFQAVFDLENIETGWLYFPTGAGPDIRTVKLGLPMPDRPSDKHRSGYRVLMLLGKQSGGDVREMAANAQVSIKGMDLLHDAYMAGRASNPGMLPVVSLAGTIPVVTQGKANGQAVTSTNYQPVWQIVKWVPRSPELLPDALNRLTAPLPQQAQPAPVAVAPPPPPQPPLPLAPPAPVQQARQLASVEDDF